jgi:hypothetical protein
VPSWTDFSEGENGLLTEMVLSACGRLCSVFRRTNGRGPGSNENETDAAELHGAKVADLRSRWPAASCGAAWALAPVARSSARPLPRLGPGTPSAVRPGLVGLLSAAGTCERGQRRERQRKAVHDNHMGQTHDQASSAASVGSRRTLHHCTALAPKRTIPTVRRLMPANRELAGQVG